MKSENVLAWRESLIQLADQHFFDLMRLYLGVIKTPFNKQKLIMELSAFLRKKEYKEKIILALDETDVVILSAISELPQPTRDKIFSLFKEQFSFPFFYERLLNLEERLLIYKNTQDEKIVYFLNPLIEEELLPFLGISALVKVEAKSKPVASPLLLDNLLLSALYSYFLQHDEELKNDGSLRKKTIDAIKKAFPQLDHTVLSIEQLLAVFQNLELLQNENNLLKPNIQKFESFAQLEPLIRLALLIGASQGSVYKDSVLEKVQIFLDFFISLDSESCYTKDSLTRLFTLYAEKPNTRRQMRSQNRFTSLLIDYGVHSDLTIKNFSIIDAALCFGALLEVNGLYMKNNASISSPKGEIAKPFLIVSPTFTVTIMPGFSLAELLPLTAFMALVEIQTVGQFEITKKSCVAAFASGLTDKDILRSLQKYSSQDLPQNVLFSISDWYRSFLSFSLYQGYVLQVEETRRTSFENNPKTAKLIKKTLAPGIYLLAPDNEELIAEAFLEADIETPLVAHKQRLSKPNSPFPKFVINDKDSFTSEQKQKIPAKPIKENQQKYAQMQEALILNLQKMPLSKDERDVLTTRIKNKIILSESQLVGESIRLEKVEARGVDFLGKVRLVEHTISTGSLLEINIEENSQNLVFIGKPLKIEKKQGDASVFLELSSDQSILEFSLSQVLAVRRIRGSIFSE